MNVLQMVEMVIQAYPSCGQTEILQVMQSVTESFCVRSRVLRHRVSVNGTFSSDMSAIGSDGLATEWDMPGYIVNVYERLSTWRSASLDFFEVTAVQYDLQLLPKYPRISSRVWAQIKDSGAGFDRIAIMYYNGTNDGGKAVLSEAVDIAVSGICRVADNFAWTTFGTTTLPIPAEFHLPIVHGVLQHFALVKAQNPRLADYHGQLFEKGVVMAKSRGNQSSSARGAILNDI